MRFGELPARARRYVLCVFLCGALIAGVEWWLATGSGGERDVVRLPGLFAALTLAAAVAHSFPVSAPGRQAYHVSLPFFMAAIIALPPIEVTGLLAGVHLAEWLRVRRRRSWFAQVFNVAAYIMTAAAAQAVYVALAPLREPAGDHLAQPQFLVAGIAAAAAFAFVNRALVSLAIWLGNGIPLRRQQMFEPESVLTDAILLVMGLPLVILALVAPWVVVLSAAPLVLIYRALELPALRAQRRQDALTDLYTAPYFEEVCRRELSRARRSGQMLALALVDIDGLSKTNAEYGHQAGDAVIQATARYLRGATREYDVVARIVGGEFAVLLPDVDAASVQATAERLCRGIAAQRHDVASSLEPVRVTASAGIAVSNGEHSATHLFAVAAATLAQAKREGGNCVGVDAPDALRSSTAPATAATVSPPSHRGPQPPPEPADHEAVPPSGPPADRQAPRRAETAVSANGGLGSGGQVVAQAAGEVLPAPGTEAPPASVESRGRRHWLPPVRGLIPMRHAPGVLTAGVATVAVAIAVAVSPQFPELSAGTVFLLLALVALAELQLLELYDRSSYSVSTVPVLAAVMLLGVPGAVVIAPINAVIRGISRRSRWYKVLFNAGTYVISAAAAAAVFRQTAPSLVPANLPLLLLSAALCGATYYLHTFVVAVAMATELRMGPLRLWAENFRWLWPHYLVLSLMGLLLALAYQAFGVVGVAAFLIPPLMMRYVAKQYLDRTLDNVRQQRALNEQLALEIAQRRAAEEHSAALAHEAARVSALQELDRLKSELISSVSHELRTPLSLVHAYAELLSSGTSQYSTEQLEVVLREIHYGSSSMMRIVDDLLDFSRIEQGRLRLQLRAADLVTVVERAAQAFAVQPGGERIVLALPPAPILCLVDPDRIGQIVANLLSNALRYAPDGPIAIRMVEHGGGGEGGGAAAEQVIIEVQDAGPGMEPEVLERVWEMFYRAPSAVTSSHRGAGIGLAVVKHIAQAHDGAVEAISTPGRGATFRVFLPRRRPPDENGQPDATALDGAVAAECAPRGSAAPTGAG
ncbi:MAG: diguanylate cyclase [Chloroflexi bacterium]|nr:diguanylate cyclase [Chloroflexota bacterium]